MQFILSCFPCAKLQGNYKVLIKGSECYKQHLDRPWNYVHFNCCFQINHQRDFFCDCYYKALLRRYSKAQNLFCCHRNAAYFVFTLIKSNKINSKPHNFENMGPYVTRLHRNVILAEFRPNFCYLNKIHQLPYLQNGNGPYFAWLL